MVLGFTGFMTSVSALTAVVIGELPLAVQAAHDKEFVYFEVIRHRRDVYLRK